MLSSKRLPFVFRMSVITLIALGTYSCIQAQTQYTSAPQPQEQSQTANQRSGGGLISRLFGMDDPPKNTNNVASANAAQTTQPQPVPRQTGTSVTPPPPTTTRGGYPSATAGAAVGTRPVSQQQNQVAQVSPPGTAFNQPATNRIPLAQTVNGSGSGIPESQQLRLAELYNRIDLNTNPSNTGGNSQRAISIGGPPSPPPVSGTEEIERSQQKTTESISTGRNTAEGRVADNPRPSLSTSPKVDIPADIPERASSEKPPLRRVTPDIPPATKTPGDVPKTVENIKDLPAPEPTPQETTERTERIAQAPEPAISPLPAQSRQLKPLSGNEGLMTHQSPMLNIAREGPSAMIVGKEETYKFIVTNNSSVMAEAVVLSIELPRWVQSTQTPELSTGSTKQLPLNDEYGIFQWQVAQIAPNKSETLTLHLVTREKRPFELKYNYEVKQTAPSAKIDVQQPVVKLVFEGPDELLWGSKDSYRLKIGNVGNGDANDLVLSFSASGIVMGETTINSLSVGDERILDIEVETKEPDMKELAIKIQVTGPYGLTEETSKLVVIKRAALELDIDAPGMQYVGNTLDYVLIARNTGTTASSNTVVEATLPLGIKYVSSTNNGEFDSETNRVRWTAGTLPVGGQFDCMLVCEAKRDGECRLDAKVMEKTGLEAAANATTYVEAIADVLLDIEKPQDPIEVGTTTEYVFTITNRGSKAAENVDVGVYFAPGAIEPVDVVLENARINVERSEVVFDSIPVLSAGETLKYKVKARGLVSGNHRIQAMLVCLSTETQLTNQVMSRFYEGHNSRVPDGGLSAQPDARLRKAQPSRDNTSSLALGHASQGNRGMSVPGAPIATPGIPSATGSATILPGSPVVNPLAGSGSVTSRMQLSATEAENAIPVLNIPDLNFDQQPITTPAFGTSSVRPQRATGSVPTLSPPPLIDANRAAN